MPKTRRPDQRATGRRRRNTAGVTSEPGGVLPDDALALIWTLTEEGRSSRAVAEQVGCAPSTVSKTLAQDPIRLEALRARQREARSLKWRELESVGVSEALAWLEVLTRSRPAFLRTGKKQMSQRAVDRLAVLPRILTSLKSAAAEGSKQVQLLTGGLTERVGQEQSGELTAEQIVQLAIEAGMVEQLPPRLREYARAKAGGAS